MLQIKHGKVLKVNNNNSEYTMQIEHDFFDIQYMVRRLAICSKNVYNLAMLYLFLSLIVS